MKHSLIFTIVALSSVLALAGCGASNTNTKGDQITHGSFSVAQQLKPVFNADVNSHDTSTLIVKYYGEKPTVSSDAFGGNSGIKLVPSTFSEVKDFFSNTFTSGELTETLNVVFQPTASTPLGPNIAKINISQTNSDSNEVTGSKQTVTFNNNTSSFSILNKEDFNNGFTSYLNQPVTKSLTITYQGSVAPTVDSPAFHDANSGLSKAQSTPSKIENYFTNVFSSSGRTVSYDITYKPTKLTPLGEAASSPTITISQGPTSKTGSVSMPVSLNNTSSSFQADLASAGLTAEIGHSISTTLTVSYKGGASKKPIVNIVGAGVSYKAAESESSDVYTITFTPIKSTPITGSAAITIKQGNTSITSDYSNKISLTVGKGKFEAGFSKTTLDITPPDKTATSTLTVNYSGQIPNVTLPAGMSWIKYPVSSNHEATVPGYDSADKYIVTYQPTNDPGSFKGTASFSISQADSDTTPSTIEKKIDYSESKSTFTASLANTSLAAAVDSSAKTTLTVVYTGNEPKINLPEGTKYLTCSDPVPSTTSSGQQQNIYTITFAPKNRDDENPVTTADIAIQQSNGDTQEVHLKLGVTSKNFYVASVSDVLQKTSDLKSWSPAIPEGSFSAPPSDKLSSYYTINAQGYVGGWYGDGKSETAGTASKYTVKGSTRQIDTASGAVVPSVTYHALSQQISNVTYGGKPAVISFERIYFSDPSQPYDLDTNDYKEQYLISLVISDGTAYHSLIAVGTDGSSDLDPFKPADADGNAKAFSFLSQDTIYSNYKIVASKQDGAATDTYSVILANKKGYMSFSYAPQTGPTFINGVDPTGVGVKNIDTKFDADFVYFSATIDRLPYADPGAYGTGAVATTQENYIVELSDKALTFIKPKAPTADLSATAEPSPISINSGTFSKADYQSISCNTIIGDSDQLPQTCYLLGENSTGASINIAKLTIDSTKKTATVTTGSISSVSITPPASALNAPRAQIDADAGTLLFAAVNGQLFKSDVSDPTHITSPTKVPGPAQPATGTATPYAVYQD